MDECIKPLMLGLVLLGQGALAIAMFVKSDFIKIPEDITGNEAKVGLFAILTPVQTTVSGGCSPWDHNLMFFFTILLSVSLAPRNPY